MSSTAVRVEKTRRVGRQSTAIPGTRLAPWVFITPFFLLQLVWIVGPAAYAVWLSLYQDTEDGNGPFVGWGNYIKALQDPSFLDSLGHVAQFVLIVAPIFLIGATMIAVLLDGEAGYGKNPARVLMYLPITLPSSAAAIMWAFNYTPSSSMFGGVLGLLGVRAAVELGRPGWLSGAITNVVLWQNLGAWIVLLTTSLRGIPGEIVEMARTEGAGALALIRYIKVPLIAPTIFLMLISVATYMVTLITEPSVLSSTLAISSTFTPNMWISSLTGQAFFSLAAAAALLLMLVLLPFTLAISIRSGFYRQEDRN